MILRDWSTIDSATAGAIGPPMPAQTPKEHPKKVTWEDCLPPDAPPPDQLFTRDELIERLRRYNIYTHTNELRYWERDGVVPHPVRRWHNGAVRALYPLWYGYLVRRIQALRTQGYSLAQITPRIHAYIEHSLGTRTDVIPDLLRDHIDIETNAPFRLGPPYWDVIDGPEDLDTPASLSPALRELAGQHARYTGVATARIDVHIIDVDGGDTIYPFTIPVPGEDG